ncbi:MAG: FkbM family methyltransferase [Cyclobacteriaceae bacterium]
MFGRLLNKFRRHRQKHTFHEYDFEVQRIELPEFGWVEYAHWQHPFYHTKPISGGLIEFYKRYLKPGDVALDIGAHEGDTTVPMALAVGASGAVMGFEPNPHVFKVLEANAKLNPSLVNIIPLNFAATHEDGTFTFGSGDAAFANGGIVGFSNNKASNNRYTFEVRGKNIQTYLTQHHNSLLPRLKLVKTDAEGYDKEILKSISSLLREYKPVVISECFRESKKSERAELYQTLSQIGYQIYRLPGFDDSTPEPISAGQMMDWKHFDIIALPEK